MDNKDEVLSDDGSFILIDFDDYASDPGISYMKSDVHGNLGQPDDGSLSRLSSELSYKLVMSKGENVNNTTVSEDNLSDETISFLSNWQLGEVDEGCEIEEETEERQEAEEDEEGAPDIEFHFSVDVYERGKRRRNLKFDIVDINAPINLRPDAEIKDLVKDQILRYLPAKALARYRLVSRDWNKWISSPFFAHTQGQYFKKTSGFFHDNNQSISFIPLDKSAYGVPYPSLRFLPVNVFIRSSCNGLLLCQAEDDENEYYVCNPANKMWVKLPSSSFYYWSKPKIVLAFEPSSLNFESCYQVICPFSHPEEPIVNFNIYDSNTKSWRISDTICVEFDESKLNSDGVYIDGVVYWETTGGELLAFDMKNEIYGVQTLPHVNLEGGAVSKVHGELSYVKPRYHQTRKMCMVDVYCGSLMVLKKTISFEISFDDLEEDDDLVKCRVLANPCDDVLAVIVEKLKGPGYLYVYDVRDEKVEKLSLLWSSDTAKLFPYVNSLVSVAA